MAGAEQPATVVADPAETLEIPDVFEIPNGKKPMQGLLTGGQPSTEALERVAAAGYGTVINLRSPEEAVPFDEQATVEALGMRYVAIPIASAADLTGDKARQLAQALGEAEKPVLLHCGSGNRVGALLALKAYHVDGQDAESALALGREAGLTRLEGAAREAMGDREP